MSTLAPDTALKSPELSLESSSNIVMMTRSDALQALQAENPEVKTLPPEPILNHRFGIWVKDSSDSTVQN